MEYAEIVIADGLSTDRTRDEIQRFKDTKPAFEVKIVDNFEKSIPSALNHALDVCRGEFIIRMDAHSRPDKDYIKKCISHLEKDIADNVGGVWKILPGEDTWMARSIAAAAAHKLGVGNALYRYTTRAEFVDTVPFGSYRKSLFERIGKFDEKLMTNEDYEFNMRIITGGGKIYLDPDIRCDYYARPSLGSLAKQYWRYGFWKRRMLRKYPGTLKLRQLLPPVFVASLAVFGLAGIWFTPSLWLFGVEILLYLLTLCLASIIEAVKGKNISLVIGLPLAIATMHFSWGTGFLFSMFSK